MPECIVCKADYIPGEACPRCGSDNSAWEKWKREEPGTPWGLSRFLEPHFFTPLLIASWALVFGLLGMLWPWDGVKPSILVLAVALTFVGCILTAQQVYTNRFALREEDLFRQLRRERKKRKKIGTETRASLALVIAVVLTIILALLLIKNTLTWNIAESLALKPPAEGRGEEESEFRARAIRAFPLICLIGYVLSFTASAYSSSLMLAREYARRLNEKVPQPIFLQDEKLAQIVRREAEVELGRLDPKGANAISLMGYLQFEGQTDPQILHLSPSVELSTTVAAPLSPQVKLWGQAATWVWDELVRTDDGGIEMKVARQDIYQMPQPTQDSDHRPHPRVHYIVRADPWGRVVEVKRDVE